MHDIESAESIEVDSESRRPPQRLVDRLTPVIGKTSSGIADLLEEMIHRALLGGVEKVDAEIGDFVHEKVSTTITEHTPRIEHIAEAAAEVSARQTASVVAGQKVEELDKKTSQTAHELSQKIEAADRQAAERTEQTAERLAVRIEAADRQAAERTEQTAERLAVQIDAVDQKAQEETRRTALDLTEKIGVAEKRAHETASSYVIEQIQEVVQRSGKTAAKINESLQQIESKTTSLQQELVKERTQREAQAAASQTYQASLLETIQALEDRLAELERPKGLIAFVKRLFSKKE